MTLYAENNVTWRKWDRCCATPVLWNIQCSFLAHYSGLTLWDVEKTSKLWRCCYSTINYVNSSVSQVNPRWSHIEFCLHLILEGSLPENYDGMFNAERNPLNTLKNQHYAWYCLTTMHFHQTLCHSCLNENLISLLGSMKGFTAEMVNLVPQKQGFSLANDKKILTDLLVGVKICKGRESVCFKPVHKPVSSVYSVMG